jgi:glycosyltransferase involved in cell wall biosynthesis
MQAADVFIMPSLIEGFGLTYLEALAAGCHVVGTANTGLPDLHLSDAACTLVPTGDLTALEGVIEDLIARRAACGLDPVAISAEAAHWTWQDFRAGIAAHARRVIG